MKFFLTMSNKLIGSVTNEIDPQESTYSPVVYELVQFLKRHKDMHQVSYAFDDRVAEGVTFVTVSKQLN